MQYPSNWTAKAPAKTFELMGLGTMTRQVIIISPNNNQVALDVGNVSKTLDPTDLQVKALTARDYGKNSAISLLANNFNIIKNEPTIIGGQSAWTVSYTINAAGKPLDYGERTYVVKDDKVYELSFDASPSDVAHLRPIVQEIFHSVQFIE
jgi:hypothetical protein